MAAPRAGRRSPLIPTLANYASIDDVARSQEECLQTNHRGGNTGWLPAEDYQGCDHQASHSSCCPKSHHKNCHLHCSRRKISCSQRRSSRITPDRSSCIPQQNL
ncbi:hypothetical protein O181_048924 [Austropuccinia psidii MF-1]|uniref:Uncharacterized protein n=1 Tax=Austropuccinia psidii MF-1 TaxID=1389203 RepID=A0A9Q3DTT5_9BASI|nr:hypothetical protein [Austropuccinia psidii MF-1]